MFYDTKLAVFGLLNKKIVNLIAFYFFDTIFFANFECPLKTH